MASAAEDTGLHRFTVDEYHRMAEAGILRRDDRVELINGVIREMSPINPPHVVATTLTRELFTKGLAGRAAVYEQSPLRLDALDSEPQPDVTVYSNPDVRAFGTPETQPLLAIEVAVSTLGYDLNVKADLYAKGGLPEYWVLDVEHRVLHIFTTPRDDGYAMCKRFEPGDCIAPTAWPDFEIDVAALFPSEADVSS